MHLIVAPFLLKSTEQQRELLDIYRDALAEAGYEPASYQVIANYHLALVSSEGELRDAEQYLFRYLDFLADAESKQKSYLDKQQYAAYAPAEARSRDVEDVRAHCAVVGTAQQCIDRIAELAEACGLSGWMFHINYGGVPHERVIEQMHLFAEDVMPTFASPHELAASTGGALGRTRSTSGSVATIEMEPLSNGRLASTCDAWNATATNGEALSPTRLRISTELASGARDMTSRAVSYWRSCVLFAANKLEIFSTVGHRTMTAGDVAGELQLDVRGTEKLLNACASLGLMQKEGSRYSLSEDSRLYLDRSSSVYLGDWVAHWADMLAKGNWQRLDEAVRSGQPVAAAQTLFGFDDRRDPMHNWVVGMHEMGVAGHADLLASAASIDNVSSLLDVGGGPGTYSIYLCRRFPALEATIVDAPDVAIVAKKLIAQANLNERVHIVNLDFRTQGLGRKFDIVLLSNVLHMCCKADALLMLRNAAGHLAQRGRLVIQEWILNDDATGPELAALFDLHMLLNPNADVYRFSELIEMITQCGFRLVESIPTGGLYDLMIAQRQCD